MRMRDWIKANRKDPVVKDWLEKHPPPKRWHGTRLEWAFTEMPEYPVRMLHLLKKLRRMK